MLAFRLLHPLAGRAVFSSYRRAHRVMQVIDAPCLNASSDISATRCLRMIERRGGHGENQWRVAPAGSWPDDRIRESIRSDLAGIHDQINRDAEADSASTSTYSSHSIPPRYNHLRATE